MTISMPVTEVNKENIVVLDQIPYMYYPIYFNKNKVQTLIDFGSKVNVMTIKYALKLGLKIRPIDIEVQKIDSFILKTLGMVLPSFQIEDKLKKARFFQKIFLLAEFDLDMVLRIFFLTLSNTDI